MATLCTQASLMFYFLTLILITVSGELLFEEGYTVTTLLDGNKKGINPYSVLPASPASSDLVVLDSSGSVFYTLSFHTSQEGAIKKYSGNGVAGFSDGELDSAMFNKPKSFAVDLKGNLYVADKNNHAIRKISKSGVTTIAGGYSQKPGHADGPARNASFSDDFELNFIPGSCALLISDHGNKLIRQIKLKREDCSKDSPSVLGITSGWILALVLGVACLFGLLAGFFIRPYVSSYEAFCRLHYRETWKHFLMNLGKRAVILCFDAKSAIVSLSFYDFLKRLVILCMSHVTLMFSPKKVKFLRQPPEPVSFIDAIDFGYTTNNKSQMYANQLQDLITFDGGMESSDNFTKSVGQTHGTDDVDYSLCSNFGNIERMIHDNLTCLSQPAISGHLQQIGNITYASKRNHSKQDKVL